MTDRDERIREIAYFLWLDEGSPEGAADRHWLAAETLVGSDPLEASHRSRAAGQPDFPSLRRRQRSSLKLHCPDEVVELPSRVALIWRVIIGQRSDSTCRPRRQDKSR